MLSVATANSIMFTSNGRREVFADIEIPKPLYDYWPTLCVCISVGYFLADAPLVATGMIIYAGTIWCKRLLK